MRDRPFPQRHTTCATPGFTRAPSQPAQDQPSPSERKPRLFNKWIILWGAEKCCRNVIAVRYNRRARRAERVGQSFTRIEVRMQLRRSRTQSLDARERYRGYLRKQASDPTLYKDHQPPTIQLGFPPCKIAATPLTNLQICSTLLASASGQLRRAADLLLLSPRPPLPLLPLPHLLPLLLQLGS